LPLLPFWPGSHFGADSQPNEVSADNGFCSEANLEGLIARTVRGYVAAGRASTPDGGTKGGKLVQAMRSRLRQGGHRSRYRM